MKFGVAIPFGGVETRPSLNGKYSYGRYNAPQQVPRYVLRAPVATAR